MAVAGVQLYAVGLVHMSACAPKDWPADAVESAANVQHPTGLDHGWHKSDDPTFKGGEPNPCRCNDDPERLHWLLVC